MLSEDKRAAALTKHGESDPNHMTGRCQGRCVNVTLRLSRPPAPTLQ